MLSSIRHRVKLGMHPLPKPTLGLSRPSLEPSPTVDGIIHSDGSAASSSYPPGGGGGGSESSFNAQKGAVSFMQRIRTLAPSQQADPPEAPATSQQQQRVPGERFDCTQTAGPFRTSLSLWVMWRPMCSTRVFFPTCIFSRATPFFHVPRRSPLVSARSTCEDGCVYWQHQRRKAGDDLNSHVPGER